MQGYRSFQDDENKAVVYELLTSPDDYVKHFERYAASVVSIIGFGRRIASITDPIVTEVLSFMQVAAHVAVIAKDFPRLMESFPSKLLSRLISSSRNFSLRLIPQS